VTVFFLYVKKEKQNTGAKACPGANYQAHKVDHVPISSEMGMEGEQRISVGTLGNMISCL
jgi:hypothetical protein